MPEFSQHPENHNSLRVTVVVSADQMLHVLALRSICFFEEYHLSVKQAFDGNDYHASHIIMYCGDEPIACCRIRWFRDFAKIERTGLRKEYRQTKALKILGEFVFDHIARKGYDTVTTTAAPDLARLWRLWFRFKPHPTKLPHVVPGHGEHVDLVKKLDVRLDAIKLDDPVDVLLRVEGQWDQPSDFA